MDRCCQLALRQPLPDKQLVLTTDASFQAAGYAVLIEDDPNQKYTSTGKAYAPIAYGSETYTPTENQNFHVRKRTSNHLSGVQRIWTYNLGCDKTSDYHDR